MKNIIIMGASSGLGYGLAEHYIACGWNVGLAARRQSPLRELAAKAAPGQRVEIAQIDVCGLHEAAEALQRLCERLGGRLDVYLHCSGIGRMTPEIHFDDELPMIQTNVLGWTACIDWAYRLFEAQGYGQLAAITSFAANRGLALAPAYASTKAYQAHYLESLRQRAMALGLRRVCITDLRPGFVATPLLAHPERLFWVLTPEQAVRAMHRAIDRRARIATVTLRWRLLAPVLRIAPRWLVARILGKAL